MAQWCLKPRLMRFVRLFCRNVADFRDLEIPLSPWSVFINMPTISEEKRGRIIALKEEGYNQETIANRVGVAQTSVSYTLRKYDKTDTVAAGKQSGRPRQATTQTDGRIH